MLFGQRLLGKHDQKEERTRKDAEPPRRKKNRDLAPLFATLSSSVLAVQLSKIMHFLQNFLG
jgi:hypothetical protein